ncbi:tetratricopeptide repeat protein [Paracoccaceae bacterium]|nr:tetratricopeptide repeat protein [Paracoccaceae bacterium]
MTQNPKHQLIDELISIYYDGQFEKALLKIKPLIIVFPNAMILFNLQGACNAALMKYGEAISSYKRAININPDNADCYNNMGVAFQHLGDLDAAINSYDKALKINHVYPEAHNNMGNALRKKGKLNAAINSYKQAIKIKPDYAEAYFEIGNTLYGKGDLNAAVESYKRAIKIKPDYAIAYFKMGNAMRGKRDLDKAIESYECALKIKPDYAEAYNNMGFTLKENGDLGSAIYNYRNALNIKPDYAEAHLNMGNAQRDKGDLDAAIRSFETVLEKDPEDALGARLSLASISKKGIPNRTPSHYMKNFYQSKARFWGKNPQYNGYVMIEDAIKNSCKEHLKIDILDLGCGAGTLAKFLKPFATTLYGVDMSPEMLKEAQTSDLYDFLYEKDLEIYLQETPYQYDLVIAAAVMIHFFDLEHVFSLILNKLKKNGKFIFSVFEASVEEKELNSFLMYSHSDKYISSLAARLNCKICYRKKGVHEYHPEPIYGIAYVFEKIK